MDDTTQANATVGVTPRSMAGSFATVASFALATGALWGVHKATQSLRSWWRGKEGSFSSDDVAHEHDAHSESSDWSHEKGCHGPPRENGSLRKSVPNLTRTCNHRMDAGDTGSEISDAASQAGAWHTGGECTADSAYGYVTGVLHAWICDLTTPDLSFSRQGRRTYLVINPSGLSLEESSHTFEDSTVFSPVSYPSLTSPGNRFYYPPNRLLVVDRPSAVTANSAREPRYREYDPDTDGPRVEEVAD